MTKPQRKAMLDFARLLAAVRDRYEEIQITCGLNRYLTMQQADDPTFPKEAFQKSVARLICAHQNGQICLK